MTRRAAGKYAVWTLAAFAGSRLLHADSKKLTEDQRIELVRGLTAEYAKIKTVLPISRKPLEFHSDGTWDATQWKTIEKERGPAGRVGDLIQVTRIEIDRDRIVFELNGGDRTKTKWYQHIEVMGPAPTMQTSQTGPATSAPGGTTLALLFGGPIGEVTSAEIKKMLSPLLDFDKDSITEGYAENLPEPVKQAIRSKKVIEGMNRDEVLLALGRPIRKSRETKDGAELEDWIYGEPPGRVTFVTFSGPTVIRVKETYAGLGGSVADTAPVQ